MDVVNQTPSVVHSYVSSLDDPSRKHGFVIAKTTYAWDQAGKPVLETQKPFEIWVEDQETDLGLLPTDLVPRYDDAFEVILLGAAHGDQVAQMMVSLSVGGVRREMVVTGDRRWWGEGPQATVTHPEPFDRMPLTWERAFGGTAACHLDPDSVMDLSHTMNPRGRGFDAVKMARDVSQAFACAAGYPRLEYERLLPNVEHPMQRVARPTDEPLPYCWATVFTDSAVHLIRQITHMTQRRETLSEADAMRMLHHRAHPEWILDLPAAGARVEMVGLTPEGHLAFELPQLRILADYELGPRKGTKELAPQMLVLLPEERRLYMIHRLGFSMETEPAMARSFRIRHEPGWFQPTNGSKGPNASAGSSA